METQRQTDNLEYFTLRQVHAQDQAGTVLPAWLNNELTRLYPSPAETRILDLGCGLGQNLAALLTSGYNASGVDINSSAIAVCRQNGLPAERITTLSAWCKSATTKRIFDAVFMSHVLEHIEKKEIIATLRLVRERILKPDGHLILAVPNAQSRTGTYWAYEDFTHETLFTAGSLQYVLNAAGYPDVRFLDIKGTSGQRLDKRILRTTGLACYRTLDTILNRITGSSWHAPSPRIFTWEIKAVAAAGRAD